jgi:hypothetical protein
MVKLATKYTENFVIGGDFNHLQIPDIETLFNLTNIVHFPTRGEAYLGKIYTNIREMKQITAEKLAPLQDRDHDVVYIPRINFAPDQAERVTYRKVKRTAREKISHDIALIDWSYITDISDADLKA